MLVKIKKGDQTFEFDSRENAIAILLDPKDKEAIDKMDHNQLLILSAPLALMRDKAADTMAWAETNWKGATNVAPNSIDTQLLRKFN